MKSKNIQDNIDVKLLKTLFLEIINDLRFQQYSLLSEPNKLRQINTSIVRLLDCHANPVLRQCVGIA